MLDLVHRVPENGGKTLLIANWLNEKIKYFDTYILSPRLTHGRPSSSFSRGHWHSLSRLEAHRRVGPRGQPGCEGGPGEGCGRRGQGDRASGCSHTLR